MTKYYKNIWKIWNATYFTYRRNQKLSNCSMFFVSICILCPLHDRFLNVLPSLVRWEDSTATKVWGKISRALSIWMQEYWSCGRCCCLATGQFWSIDQNYDERLSSRDHLFFFFSFFFKIQDIMKNVVSWAIKVTFKGNSAAISSRWNDHVQTLSGNITVRIRTPRGDAYVRGIRDKGCCILKLDPKRSCFFYSSVKYDGSRVNTQFSCLPV